jgi:hypothetical protein
MELYWQLPAVMFVYVIMAWIGQKAIERYLGRSPALTNNIFAAGVRMGVLALFMFLSLTLWEQYFVNPTAWMIAFLTAILVGDLGSQSLWGKRPTDLN